MTAGGMRILYLTGDPLGQGANYLRAYHLGRALAGRGHLITLITRAAPSGSTVEEAQGMEILTVPAWAPGPLKRLGLSPLEIGQRLAQVRNRDFGIVHGFGHRPSAALPAVAVGRRGAVHVADWCDWWGFGGIADQRGSLARMTVGWYDHVLERLSRRHANAVTVATEGLARQAEQLGVARVHRLRGGADTRRIRPLDAKASRRELNLEAEGHFLLHAGLSAFDMHGVFEVYGRVRELDPAIQLLVAGRDPKECQRLAAQFGIRDGVIAFGFVPPQKLGELLACADVMLLPFADVGFNRGGFPHRLGDYLAAGRPVVTNPTGEVGRFCQQHEICVLAEEDPRAMAVGVVELMSDRALRERMGRRNRAVAEEILAWPKVAETLEAFYLNLISLSAGIADHAD